MTDAASALSGDASVAGAASGGGVGTWVSGGGVSGGVSGGGARSFCPTPPYFVSTTCYAPEQAWSTVRGRNGGTAGAFGGAAAGAGGAGDAGAAGAGDGGVLSPSDCPARELFLSLYSGGPALVDGQCCYSWTPYCG